MSELRLTTSSTIAASDGRPLTLRSLRLIAGDDGTAYADIEDGHGQPLGQLRCGPEELTSARWWRSDSGGRTISGFGVHLTGEGAVLLVDVAAVPDPARGQAGLVIDDTPPRERSYRASHELTDTPGLRRPKP
jgi:hypothetical protein